MTCVSIGGVVYSVGDGCVATCFACILSHQIWVFFNPIVLLERHVHFLFCTFHTASSLPALRIGSVLSVRLKKLVLQFLFDCLHPVVYSLSICLLDIWVVLNVHTGSERWWLNFCIFFILSSTSLNFFKFGNFVSEL